MNDAPAEGQCDRQARCRVRPRSCSSRGARRRRRADIQPEPLPHPAPERVEAAIGVKAVGAKVEPARPKSCDRASPAARERVASARFRCRLAGSVERQLHRALQRRGGLEQARESTEVRDAREHRGACAKPGEPANATKESNESRVDTSTRRFVSGPVERDAALVRVVARRVRRKVAGTDEEQSQVPASDAHDRAASAQQSVDLRFLGPHLGRAAIRADQHHPREALRRS